MHKEVQSWLEEVREESGIQWEYRKSIMREDPDQYGGILKAFLDEKEYYCTGWGLLLTGTDPYGREATAVKMLKHLEQPEYGGYEPVFLDAMELGDDPIGRLNVLLDAYYDRKTGLCLVLEKLEGAACRWEVLRFLGRQLRAYYLYPEEYTPLFLILMDDLEQEIPDLLRSRLRLCRTNIPDQDRRVAYLNTYGASLKEYLSVELFARLTEGASFAQLRDMIDACGWLVDSREGRVLTDEELTAFLAAQMPEPSEGTVRENFYRSMEEVVERIPEILASISAGQVVVPAPVPNPVPDNGTPRPDSMADEAAYLKAKEKEIMEMKPSELMKDVLSSEFLENKLMLR